MGIISSVICLFGRASLIGIEAALGHDVKQVPPAYAKPSAT
jgi:hypothetical protein